MQLIERGGVYSVGGVGEGGGGEQGHQWGYHKVTKRNLHYMNQIRLLSSTLYELGKCVSQKGFECWTCAGV